MASRPYSGRDNTLFLKGPVRADSGMVLCLTGACSTKMFPRRSWVFYTQPCNGRFIQYDLLIHRTYIRYDLKEGLDTFGHPGLRFAVLRIRQKSTGKVGRRDPCKEIVLSSLVHMQMVLALLSCRLSIGIKSIKVGGTVVG